MPSSMWCVAAALGGCYLTTSRRGVPFTTTSGPGASTAPGRGCTRPCTEGRGLDSDEKALGLSVKVVRPPSRWVWVREGQEPPPRPAFTVLQRRWVVERTFSWLSQNRRMSKDYERLPESAEALIHVAMTRLMVRR